MINAILCGCSGKMGKVIYNISEDYDINIAAGVDLNTDKYADFPIYRSINQIEEAADVIIDFSHPSALFDILAYSKQHNIPAIICTTGLTSEHLEAINEMSKFVPLFFSANMSLGINLIANLAKKAVAVLQNNFDIEILEKHHNQKLDAPSGTALMLADEISSIRDTHSQYVYDRHNVRKKREKSEIGISAIRGGTIVGEHEIIFAGTDEVITISHSAASKEVFACGALKAAKFIQGKEPKLYNMKDLIEESN